ncbi:uncharacterized protein LOC130531637 isoform X3 [Takifugu flavidus]|uniref:uncharacterized protein LOC130531637 isoform X3 n=1 Tax=Takifugu flavidus TaxID=433684 RepID=UPI002544BE19|nr:uncharacterized protein LOC130531637 isoform X3 [Takifugu flavidus]
MGREETGKVNQRHPNPRAGKALICRFDRRSHLGRQVPSTGEGKGTNFCSLRSMSRSVSIGASKMESVSTTQQGFSLGEEVTVVGDHPPDSSVSVPTDTF